MVRIKRSFGGSRQGGQKTNAAIDVSKLASDPKLHVIAPLEGLS